MSDRRAVSLRGTNTVTTTAVSLASPPGSRDYPHGLGRAATRRGLGRAATRQLLTKKLPHFAVTRDAIRGFGDYFIESLFQGFPGAALGEANGRPSARRSSTGRSSARRRSWSWSKRRQSASISRQPAFLPQASSEPQNVRS